MTSTKPNGANLGFENQLWAAADKLCGYIDTSEYKHKKLEVEETGRDTWSDE